MLTPMAVPGIASTLLLNIILAGTRRSGRLNLTTLERGAADRLHRLVLEPGGPVLGQALGRLDDRDRADPGPRLVQPAAARARPDLRRRQVSRRNAHGHGHAQGTSRRASAPSRSSRASTSTIEDGEFVRLRRPLRLRQVHAAAADRRARGHHRRARS